MFEKNNELASYLSLPQEVLDFIPGNFFWKNKAGIYLGYNRPVAQALQLKNFDDLIGHTLLEVLDEKYALPLLENDDYVFSSGQETVFEEIFLNSQGEEAVHLCRKVPLLDEKGNVTGLVGIAINVSHRVTLEKKLEQATLNMEEYVQQKVDLLPTGQMLLNSLRSHLDVGRYYLPAPYNSAYLTQREVDCMLPLLEGKSAKQIGKVLKLSPRTIEFYIKKIKVKFDCRTTPELISKISSLTAH